MGYIQFQQRILDVDEIIGIGPVFRVDRINEIPSLKLYFDLYCRATTVRIETETYLQWDADKSKLIFAKFIEDHAKLFEKIEEILTDVDDWEGKSNFKI